MKVFDSVPVKKPNKNVFNLSHDVKATYNFDKIYPFLCHPIYPGDTFNCRVEAFLRAMPMFAPVMHNVDMHFYFFFVPNRLIWDEDKKHDWKIFITGGEDGMQTAEMPYFTYSDFNGIRQYMASGSLLDHMGFPSFDNDAMALRDASKVSLLPFRAYQLVWNEYFRNQNVSNPIEFDNGEGHVSARDIPQLFSFRKKAWEKDYFTSALPFQQRGEAMLLPISLSDDSGSADLNINMVVDQLKNERSNTTSGLVVGDLFNTAGGDLFPAVAGNADNADRIGDPLSLRGTATISSAQISFTGLEVGTINDFRYCLRLQQWLENNARCGSRYIEQLFSHFGVVSSDARLQRPELLGGGKVPLLFTDVAQTSYGDGTDRDVLGDLAGKGTLYGKTDGFKKYFEEHGILLGLCCIIPRTSYSQGIPRYWSAMDKTEFYFPEFAHLGEQGVLNKEVYYDPSGGDPVTGYPVDKAPNDVFGYQGRFTELRYIPSSVHGEMRTDLRYWHLGRLFDNLPALNEEFVEADSRVDVFALTEIQDSGYDPFVCQLHLDIKAVRPMPKYAVPTL